MSNNMAIKQDEGGTMNIGKTIKVHTNEPAPIPAEIPEKPIPAEKVLELQREKVKVRLR